MNVPIVANEASTPVTSNMFSGNRKLDCNVKKDAAYYDLNLQYKGEWNITTPDGKVSEIGTVTIQPDGSYKTSENPNCLSDEVSKSTKNEVKSVNKKTGKTP